MNNLIEQGIAEVGGILSPIVCNLEVNFGSQSGNIEAFSRKGTGGGNQTQTVGDSWNGELDVDMSFLVLSGIRINNTYQELRLRGLLEINTNYSGIVELCIMYIPKSELKYNTNDTVTMKLAGTFIADSLASQDNQITLNISELVPGAGEGFQQDGMLIPLFYNRSGGGNVTGLFVGDVYGI